MNRGTLIRRIVVLVLLTVMIIIAGVTVPRLFIDRKIKRSTGYSDAVEIEAISPYGENSVEVEERIKRALQLEQGVESLDYEEFSSYSNNINDFTLELFDIIEDGFGVRPSNTYMAINQKYEIMNIADFSVGNTTLYADISSGLVISGQMYFTCNRYSMYQLWSNLLTLYSKYLGIEFTERSDGVSIFDDSMYAEAITTDGVLRLGFWMEITPVSERPYEDTYAVNLYFGLEGTI